MGGEGDGSDGRIPEPVPSEESMDEPVDGATGEFAVGEAQLAQYRELREEVRMLNQHQRRLIPRGLAAVAIILAYAFTSDTGVAILAIIPIIMAFLLLTIMGIQGWIVRLEAHIRELQPDLGIAETDSWEATYPTMTGWFGLDILSVTNAAIMLGMYVGFAALSISIFGAGRIQQMTFIPVWVTRELLIWVYLGASVLIAIGIGSYVHTLRRHGVE